VKGGKIRKEKHTCVDVGVFLHVGFLVEPFAAVLARIRPGVRVDQQVSRQRRRPLERLAALSAFEHFFRVVQRPNLWRENNKRKKKIRKRPFFFKHFKNLTTDWIIQAKHYH
jgi:hypothetical protein